MTSQSRFEVRSIGIVESPLTDRASAPKQGDEGSPDAVLVLDPDFVDGLTGLRPGDEIIVLTWFHRARRDVLQVYPRSDPNRPLTGVFATRSPDRPNPVGLHRVTVRAVHANRLRIGPIEAIDGTPVIDIKPARQASDDS